VTDIHRRIGIDFDNTLARYDNVFYEASRSAGFTDLKPRQSKQQIRDHIRKQPNGDDHWQRLQAQVYGHRMAEAELFEGVGPFFHTCMTSDVEIFIVSHKTEFAKYDPDGPNLREKALQWMGDKRFFDRSGYGISKSNVYFEATRREKIARIVNLNLSLFIDDLEEVFLESDFPENVEALHFSSEYSGLSQNPFTSYRNWTDIANAIFPASR